MTINNALGNALSGLGAAGRGAEVVAANISNALTEGYGRRSVELQAKSLGGNGAGVQITGISRRYDPVLTGERRLADAADANSSARLDFFERMERAVGLPGEAGALTSELASLDAALIEAASAPESDTRLRAVLNAAQDITDHLGRATTEVQATRMEADKAIGASVDWLNESLQRVVDFNIEIQTMLSSGHDATALMDQRQVLIDNISEVVPVKEVARENGRVSLYTPGGAILVDSRAAELGFTSVGVITPDMTLDSGALSGLTINGQPASTSAARSPIEGGSLAALFEVRDELAPQAQARLDAVARDLIERFADPAVDASLTLGDPGLFTDNGGALVVADEVGLAGRIEVNALADPTQGGDLWRLRSGLGAASPGEPGDATLIQAMSDALNNARAPASGGFSSTPRSAAVLAADLVSLIETDLLSAERNVSQATARRDTLLQLELGQGVDTDQELQQLLQIEQSYAANAKVLSTIQTLIQQLMEI